MEKKNKQFFRTVTGKFLLFLIINIMLIISFGCVCASVACVQEELYGITEEDIDNELLFIMSGLLSGEE